LLHAGLGEARGRKLGMVGRAATSAIEGPGREVGMVSIAVHINDCDLKSMMFGAGASFDLSLSRSFSDDPGH
jgi:hypothetical protein